MKKQVTRTYTVDCCDQCGAERGTLRMCNICGGLCCYLCRDFIHIKGHLLEYSLEACKRCVKLRDDPNIRSFRDVCQTAIDGADAVINAQIESWRNQAKENAK